jgi:hypothetical protein
MIDKIKCRDVVPLWSFAPFEDGSGENRLVFAALAEKYACNTTGRATSFYTINEQDPNHPVRLQMMRERGVVLPADRRDGAHSLADAIAEIPRSSATPAPAPVADRLLDGVIEKLKPREIVVLQAGDGDVALKLRAIVERAGLDALIVAADSWSAAEYDRTWHRLGTAAVALPPRIGDAATYLAKRRVAVDFVYLSEQPKTAAIESAWRLLRRGGLLVAGGEVGPDVTSFAAEAGSEILPAVIDGAPSWVLHKP